MPAMIDRIADALLTAWKNQPYEIDFESEEDKNCRLWFGDGDSDYNLIMTGSYQECQKEMRKRVARLYAKAALTELLKPDAAMVWARSKGYEAMIQAALDSG